MGGADGAGRESPQRPPPLFFLRRKLSSAPAEGARLARCLGAGDLVSVGVGSTVGAGVYVLIGTAARELAGPAIVLSFGIAGLAATLSAICYAELASRNPSAGSAYAYSYSCIGEGVAWLIGWALILEYTVSAAAVARGLLPNLGVFLGTPPGFGRLELGPGIMLDPAAPVFVLLATWLLASGIQQGVRVQALLTWSNVAVLSLVVVVGGALAARSGFPGLSEENGGWAPYGAQGVISGAAMVFFSYIGFDTVASTAEEVREPQRDLPRGIVLSLALCATLYMAVGGVLTALVPSAQLDKDTPISTALADAGLPGMSVLVAVGAVASLCTTLMGSLLPQPRVLMAMSRDGLLPPWVGEIRGSTMVPLNATILTGVAAAALAAAVDIEALSDMVSAGTLLAFTVVSISLLILRYAPPGLEDKDREVAARRGGGGGRGLQRYSCDPAARRSAVGWAIGTFCACVPAVALAARAASAGGGEGGGAGLGDSLARFTVAAGSTGALGAVCTLFALGEDKRGRGVGDHAFHCPGLPWLPAASVVTNVWLLCNLSAFTWLCVSAWLSIGRAPLLAHPPQVSVYLLYGRSHSVLGGAGGVQPDPAGGGHPGGAGGIELPSARP